MAGDVAVFSCGAPSPPVRKAAAADDTVPLRVAELEIYICSGKEMLAGYDTGRIQGTDYANECNGSMALGG